MRLEGWRERRILLRMGGVGRPLRAVRLPGGPGESARMTTFDDDTSFDFFEEPETQESPQRRRRRRPGGGNGEHRRPPSTPPTGGVALARLVGLVAIGIAVVLGLVFWIDACQGKSKHDEYSSYMEKVAVVGQSSARVGQELTTKLASPGLKLA